MTHVTARNGKVPPRLTTYKGAHEEPVEFDMPTRGEWLAGCAMVASFVFLAFVAGIVGLG